MRFALNMEFGCLDQIINYCRRFIAVSPPETQSIKAICQEAADMCNDNVLGELVEHFEVYRTQILIVACDRTMGILLHESVHIRHTFCRREVWSKRKTDARISQPGLYTRRPWRQSKLQLREQCGILRLPVFWRLGVPQCI
jgi:regulator of extracellular matrix RemA (YlzA/DUF370 family)